MDTETRDTSLTMALSNFVATAPWEAIPNNVRHEAKRSLVNYFATALAGSADPTIDKAIGVYGRFRAGGDAGSAANLIGRAEHTDMLNAAALNAMSANVHDFDDTHLPTIIHPTAPVSAALFALAQGRNSGVRLSQQQRERGAPQIPMTMSGQQWLHAFVLGVEIECRLGLALVGHYQRGWHITSTCGVFGAAAACAVILGLDAQQTAWAFGNASAQAGGLVETLGTMSKSISVGNAARNGLLSSLLAAEGFSGPAAPIEGARGFLRVTSDQPDFAVLTAELGQTWALESNTYKPYPCGVVLNPVIEACLALIDGADWHIGDIERIEISGNPLLRERTDRPDVATGRTSQVSAQHSVAVTLSRGRAGLAEFSDDAVADVSLREIGRKAVFVDDPGYPVEAVTVAIVFRSGQRVSHRVDAAIGSLASPLDDRTLDAKLIACAQYVGASCNTQALLDSVWHFESQQDAALPMRLAAASFSNK